MGRFLLIIGALFFIMAADKAGASDPENQIFLDLKDGRVVIDLLPDVAPKHVERIKELTREGFYNGIVFHRVIDGFMAQTGDPTGTGTGGSGKKLVAEFPMSRSHVALSAWRVLRTPTVVTANSLFALMMLNFLISNIQSGVE